MKKLLFICILILPLFLFSQKLKKDKPDEDFYIIKNDSLTIPLDEIVIFKNRKFKSKTERKYYYWYYKKVHNAYPFATLASDRLTEINKDLEGIKSKRKRRRHIKKIQKYMEGEFTDELKKLTRTEGRILIKLVHRQTGETMFELIKEYRSKWKAFWYNSTAFFFKLSLKDEYHPENEALDFIVEDILQRSFAIGSLENQESKLAIDYFNLISTWENLDIEKEIDTYIEKYK
jgi:hypothetical protein